MINVLIVDDHYLFAEGMKSLFKPEDGIAIVKHSENGKEVPSILESMDIDVVLMDIDMPILNGLETMDLVKAKGFNTPILMLTMHQTMRQIKGALEKGAQGYILKDASKAELVEAIISTSERRNYFHPKINDQIFDYFRGVKKQNAVDFELSEREKEIIKCLSEGMNTKAISNVLFISEHTVKTHRRNIMHKLKVNTSAELIQLANEKGII